MKKHKTKIIVGVVAVLVLAVSFFWGGFGGDKSGAPDASTGTPASIADTPDTTPAAPVTPDTKPAPPPADTPEASAPADATVTDAAIQASDAPASVSPTPDTTPSESTPPENTPSEKPPEPSEAQGPVQSAAPPDAPVPPDNGELTCTLIISCATVLDNMDKLREGKDVLIPDGGIIFSKTVVFYEGESVFEVLRRETKSGKIHLEYVNAPIYGSAYIEGIGNLYEFDCGERSGWMYSVNGVFPNYGSSKYTLCAGDKIEWLFTCDRGADIGGADAADSYVNE